MHKLVNQTPLRSNVDIIESNQKYKQVFTIINTLKQ